MATKADIAAAGLYTALMEELKARAFSINTATSLSSTIPPPLLREYGYLQLRMMCELIALGCLVAHGDIQATQTKAIQKAYDPAEILRRLEGLHPDFYPVPVSPVPTTDGWHLADYGEAYLTKDDLISLYRVCGGHLHKGSVRRLLKSKSKPIANFDDLDRWGQKILNLMSNHRISRIGGRFHLMAFLDLNGKVQVAIAEAPSDDR